MKIFKACKDCLDDLRYFAYPRNKLIVERDRKIRCSFKPRCFDQPQKCKVESQWISVKDRLPELLTDVLVLTTESRYTGNIKYDSRMQVAYLFERLVSEFESEETKKDILRWYIFGDITHWMPLPEHPKDNLCAEKK